MANDVLERSDGVKLPKSFVVGVGESDNTVLKDATIENSNIGHIGDQIDVTDGGKVMTASAVAAEAKLAKARAEDTREAVKNSVKDIVVPGRKLFNKIAARMDKITGIERKSDSKFDLAVDDILKDDDYTR